VGNDRSSCIRQCGAIMKRYRVGFSGGGYIVVSAETPQAALEICKPMLAPGELLIYVEEIE
jgi:hypothetical protein